MTQIVYHGSREYDLEGESLKGGMPGYQGSIGAGVYVTLDPEVARFYGPYVYASELLLDEDDIFWLTPDTMQIVPGYEHTSVLVGEQVPPFTFELKGQRYTVGYEDIKDGVVASRVQWAIAQLVGTDGASRITEAGGRVPDEYDITEWVDGLDEEDVEKKLKGAEIDTSGLGMDAQYEALVELITEPILDAVHAENQRAESELGLLIVLDDIGNEVEHAGFRGVSLEGARGRFPDEELLVFDSDDLKMIGAVEVDRIQPNPEMEVVQFVRLRGEQGGLVELFLVKRGASHFLLRHAQNGALSFGIEASGSRTEMRRALEHESENIQRGVKLYHGAYEVETTRMDAEAHSMLKAFDSPIVGIKWDKAPGAKDQADEFTRLLKRQLRDWKGSSNGLNVLKHREWAAFHEQVVKAVRKKYGSSITIYRGIWGTQAEKVLKGDVMPIRSYSSWTPSLAAAKEYRGHKGEAWAVVRMKVPSKRIALAPVELPDFAHPDILDPLAHDVAHTGDELILHSPTKSVPTSDFKIVIRTRSSRIQPNPKIVGGVQAYAAAGVMPNGDVVEMPDPPARVMVGGRSYALSNIGVPMVSEGPVATDFGARVIEGGGNPWRYIWVHEPEDGQLDMYRYSDGEWKVLGNIRDYPGTFQRLRRARQLNTVTTEEMHEFEGAMRQRNEETILAIQESWEAMKTDEQRRVEGLVRRFWDDEVEPLVVKLWADIDAGVEPIGFEYDPDFAERTGKDREAQAKSFALQLATRHAGFSPFDSPLEAYVVRRLGLPGSEGLEDLQAIQWAHGDVMDVIYQRKLGPL